MDQSPIVKDKTAAIIPPRMGQEIDGSEDNLNKPVSPSSEAMSMGICGSRIIFA